MCGADFANSLVTAADIKVVDRYLDKVTIRDMTDESENESESTRSVMMRVGC
jgi:hypothetical protein